MRTASRARAAGLTLLGALAVLLVAGASAAGPVRPGLTVTASPASRSVPRGEVAAFLVTVTPTGGFAGQVPLAVSGLPAGSRAAFSPATVSLAAGRAATSTLTVTTSAGTPAGAATLTVTASTGSTRATVPLGLTVTASTSRALALSATPSEATVAAGSTAAFTLDLVRTGVSDPVTFALASGLPTGATADFVPEAPVTTGSASLQVRVPEVTADGTYRLVVVATAGTGSQALTTYASLLLTVQTNGRSLTVSGDLPRLLSPGRSAELDLVVTNPNRKPVTVTNVSVSLTEVRRDPARAGSCGPEDFAVRQVPGPYPLVLAGETTSTLSRLGVTTLPALSMLDRSVAQDGCRGASLELTYSASAQGS